MPFPTDKYDAMKAAGVTMLQLPFALGAMAFFDNVPEEYQPASGLKLTACLLADIFNGVITTWDDPLIVDEQDGDFSPPSGEKIVVYHRTFGSSTTKGITQYLHAAFAGLLAALIALAVAATACCLSASMRELLALTDVCTCVHRAPWAGVPCVHRSPCGGVFRACITQLGVICCVRARIAHLEATLRLGVDAVALGLGHAAECLVEHVRRVALAQHRLHRADLLQAAERVRSEGGLPLGARQDLGRGRGQAEQRALPLHRLAEVGGAAAGAVRRARGGAGHRVAEEAGHGAGGCLRREHESSW